MDVSLATEKNKKINEIVCDCLATPGHLLLYDNETNPDIIKIKEKAM